MNRLGSNVRTIALLALCAAPAMAARADATTSTFPIYPGATKLPSRQMQTFSSCGHTIRFVSYATAADGTSVAKWYESTIPGAVTVDHSRTDAQTIDTEVTVSTPDGSTAAGIRQLTMTSSKMQAASRSIGAEKTALSIETFDPPLGANVLAMENRARHGDAAARRALTAKCGSP